MEVNAIALLLELIGFFIVSILLAVHNSRVSATKLLSRILFQLASIQKSSSMFYKKKDEYFQKGFFPSLLYVILGYLHTFVLGPIILMAFIITTAPVWFVIGAEKLLKTHDNWKIILSSLGTLALFTGLLIEFLQLF